MLPTSRLGNIARPLVHPCFSSLDLMVADLDGEEGNTHNCNLDFCQLHSTRKNISQLVAVCGEQVQNN